MNTLNLLIMDLESLKESNLKSSRAAIVKDLTQFFLDVRELQCAAAEDYPIRSIYTKADHIYETYYASGALLDETFNIVSRRMTLLSLFQDIRQILPKDADENGYLRAAYPTGDVPIRDSERQFLSAVIRQLQLPTRSYTMLINDHIPPQQVTPLLADCQKPVSWNVYGTSFYPAGQNNAYVKLIATPLENAKVTPRCFDIAVFRATHYDLQDVRTLVMDYNTDITMKRTISLTRIGGLFIGIIPVWHLRKQLNSYLLKNLKDIHFQIVDQAAGKLFVYGIKKKVTDPLDTASSQRLASTVARAFKLPEQYQPEPFDEPRILPGQPVEVQEFRPARLLPEDILSANTQSTLFQQLLAKRTTDSSSAIRPLLPFTESQLGIVLTSGVLNGAIREEDGSTHLVKGMAFKDPVTFDTTEGGKTVEKTIDRNRIRLTACTTDGYMVNLL